MLHFDSQPLDVSESTCIMSARTRASSLVEQIEIGVDGPDFPTALRAAVRQAPAVLVIGEMRDPHSMRIALSAAETGHLVFSSVHTMDIASTVPASLAHRPAHWSCHDAFISSKSICAVRRRDGLR